MSIILNTLPSTDLSSCAEASWRVLLPSHSHSCWAHVQALHVIIMAKEELLLVHRWWLEHHPQPRNKVHNAAFTVVEEVWGCALGPCSKRTTGERKHWGAEGYERTTLQLQSGHECAHLESTICPQSLTLLRRMLIWARALSARSRSCVLPNKYARDETMQSCRLYCRGMSRLTRLHENLTARLNSLFAK
jgi:hypothetical protein